MARKSASSTPACWASTPRSRSRGLDIGLDRGSPVSHYAAPFALRGAKLFRVEYQLDPAQRLDPDQIALVEMARQ